MRSDMKADHLCACGLLVTRDVPVTLRVQTRWGPVEVVRCPRCKLAQTRDFPDERQRADLYEGDAIYRPADDSEFERGVTRTAHVVEELRVLKPPPARVLELGSNAGYGLAAFARCGYEVVGIEANLACRSYAAERLGVRVVGAVEELGDQPAFDALYLSHVLEHVPEPVPLLASLAAHCRSDAIVYIKVPNFAGLHARLIARGTWSGFLPYQHLWYFEKTTLADVTRQAGLEPFRLHTRCFSTSSHPFLPRRWFTQALGQVERILDSAGELVGVFRVAGEAASSR